jgi:quercetin dioxygenase-like cupin family protein
MRSAQEAMDAMQVASNVYERLLENDRVRMLKVTFKPGDKAAMHHHPDHAVYVVKGGKLHFSYPSGNPESMELESGKAIFLDAQTHEATNVGDTEIELVVVEIK